MEWEKKIPDQPGYWLRVNAGHKVQLHLIEKRKDGALVIWWGGADVMKLNSRMKQWEYRMGFWQWYGPIPEPKIERRSYGR